MKTHVLQSDLWGEFKNKYGTSAIKAGGVLYTKHKIPFTNNYLAFSPHSNPKTIDFEALKISLEENSCIALHLDVPDIVIGSPEEKEALGILNIRCEVSSRDEFARGNFLMDLTKSEEDLLKNMHSKQRYNIKYAERKGVKVRKANSEEDFDIFYNLYKETAQRQKYFFRPRVYLKTLWDTLEVNNCVEILIAEYEGKPLASWFLIIYDSVLYYPYGGSSEEHRNLQASCLLGWKAIKLGKERSCTLFDMWGAAEDMEDTEDPYHGFSLFKAKYGAKHVRYIDSYDFVINAPLFRVFSTANNIRWKLLNALK